VGRGGPTVGLALTKELHVTTKQAIKQVMTGKRKPATLETSLE
jgi:hypothetical protein